MKHRSLLIVLMLICLSPLSAFKVTHLHMGTGNDWYTMGLGDNLDDGLSFGGHLMVAIDNLAFLKIDALGFTDRANTGYRYDQININLNSPLTFALAGITYTVTPLVGMTLAGDFDFERVQNNVHRGLNLAGLDLPYDNTETQYHLNLGSTLEGTFPLGWIRVGLQASYLHTFGRENSLQTVAVMKFGSSLTLKAGYSLMHNLTGGEAHQSMMDRLSGPTFSYYFDGGLVTNSWIFHANSGSSYGVIGIDVMQLFQPDSYDHSDFVYSLDSLYDKFGHSNRSFSLAFGPIIIQTRHKSGPMKNDTEGSNRRMTVASWMMGYQKEWEATALVYPYLKSLWGFQRFNLYHPVPYKTLTEEIRPAIALEAGIKFGRDGQWVAKNNSYRPRISALIKYVLDTRTLKQSVESVFAPHIGPWIFLVGFGLDIGHDPH